MLRLKPILVIYFDFITTVCIGKKQTMFLKLFNIAIFQLDLSAVIFLTSDFTTTSAFSHAYTFYVLFSVISAA